MEICLSNADHRLMELVWEAQPVASPELCRLAQERLGWKRTTTYTVIRRLCEKNCLKSEATIVTALVARDAVSSAEGRQMLERSFGGSLPRFVAAFLDGGTLSEEEIRQIEQMLEEYRRKQ